MGSPTVPKVSVVTPHYFVERNSNLPVILAALEASTVRPCEWIIWNNQGAGVSVPTSPHFPVDMIDCSKNIGPAGRFLAALLATGDEVLFLDNDTAPRPKLIESLLTVRSLLRRHAVLTVEGRQYRPMLPYGHWPKVYGHSLTATKPVDISLGRGEMIASANIQQYLQNYPFGRDDGMDDLWWSSCILRTSDDILVVPVAKGLADLHDLPQGGVGACKEAEYARRRADVAIRAFAWM